MRLRWLQTYDYCGKDSEPELQVFVEGSWVAVSFIRCSEYDKETINDPFTGTEVVE